jgi:hypothetical protein
MSIVGHDRLLALRHATPFAPHFGDLETGR